MKIETPEQHQAALREIEGLMSAKRGTPEGRRMDALVRAVEAYEAPELHALLQGMIEKIDRLVKSDRKSAALPERAPPMHPGAHLRDVFLVPFGLTPAMVAKACGVPRARIERILREELGISADTALRLARYFGTTAEFWLNLQTQFDMLTAERAIAKDLARIEPLRGKAGAV